MTGIFQRKKESFTGSTATFKKEELKMVGTQNLIQSLKTLDPSFVIMENNDYVLTLIVYRISKFVVKVVL